jgi:hypothetical protein
MKLASAMLGAAVIAGFAVASSATASRPPEEKSLVTLTSGKSFTGEIVSKRADGITLRIGTSDVVLPNSMIAKIEKADDESPRRRDPEPEPEPEPEPARGGDGRVGGVAVLEEGQPPRPAAIILKNGSVMEGYVIARSKGVLWVIPSAEPIAINEEDISSTVGNADPTSGGLSLSGDMEADARRMIEELASDDKMRMTIAATVLDKFGAEIAPVLIESLGHEHSLVRKQCIALLQNYRVKHAVGPVVAVLRGDADSEVRVAAAASLIDWNSPETRKVLIDVVARDRSDDVKMAALNTLARCATIEDASPLFDLLPMFEPASNLEKALIACFKRSTEQQFADDRDVWRKWWLDDGGREAIAEKVEKLLEERRSTPPRSPDAE